MIFLRKCGISDTIPIRPPQLPKIFPTQAAFDVSNRYRDRSRISSADNSDSAEIVASTCSSVVK